MFLGPHDIAAGGLTGLAIILEEMLTLDRAFIIIVGQVLVVALCFFFLEREVFLNTIIGAGLLPLAIAIIPRLTLIRDPMFSMTIGSVLFGVAVSILYANKASSGGTAVPPLIMQKYWGVNPAIGLLICDGIVVLFSLFVFSSTAFMLAIASCIVTYVTMQIIEFCSTNTRPATNHTSHDGHCKRSAT